MQAKNQHKLHQSKSSINHVQSKNQHKLHQAKIQYRGNGFGTFSLRIGKI